MLTLTLALAFLWQTSAPPQFDWVYKDQKELAVPDFQKGTGIRFADKASTKIKLHVAAEFPVGFAIRSSREPLSSPGSSVSCVNREVYKTNAVCILPSDTSILVIVNSFQDRRHPKINKVSVILYVWKCIENCPVEKAAAR